MKGHLVEENISYIDRVMHDDTRDVTVYAGTLYLPEVKLTLYNTPTYNKCEDLNSFQYEKVLKKGKGKIREIELDEGLVKKLLDLRKLQAELPRSIDVAVDNLFESLPTKDL